MNVKEAMRRGTAGVYAHKTFFTNYCNADVAFFPKNWCANVKVAV
jgi:hypothetical protein